MGGGAAKPWLLVCGFVIAINSLETAQSSPYIPPLCESHSPFIQRENVKNITKSMT